jgi:hypothetical protein
MLESFSDPYGLLGLFDQYSPVGFSIMGTTFFNTNNNIGLRLSLDYGTNKVKFWRNNLTRDTDWIKIDLLASYRLIADNKYLVIISTGPTYFIETYSVEHDGRLSGGGLVAQGEFHYPIAQSLSVFAMAENALNLTNRNQLNLNISLSIGLGYSF